MGTSRSRFLKMLSVLEGMAPSGSSRITHWVFACGS